MGQLDSKPKSLQGSSLQEPSAPRRRRRMDGLTFERCVGASGSRPGESDLLSAERVNKKKEFAG